MLTFSCIPRNLHTVVAPTQTIDNGTFVPVTLEPTSLANQSIALPFVSLEVAKSYPCSKVKTITKKNVVKRSHPERSHILQNPLPNNTATPTSEARQLAQLSLKTSTVAQKVEQATAEYSNKFQTKGKLSASALGTPSLDHIIKYDAVFEHTHLHLILSDFLSSFEIEHLNACNVLFHHFHKMLHHMQPEIVYKLF